ncbi:MAG: phosphate acyltransferase PlsX [Bacteroidales bacterium]|jgi:glycerol-3-phosphate acyltransferase PlsX|nr:phosphate acyltransferase PlsX [Bacteroidales bacterium]
MKIGLDVMGGDFAPEVTVLGAISAYEQLHKHVSLVLIGDEKAIIDICRREKFDPARFEIVDAPDTITMGDHPSKAFAQKTRSSIYVGYELLSAKKIDAFASAGSTGAMMVGAMYTVKSIPGILRPAIAVATPRADGNVSVLLDVGINPDCKPDILYQYGLLGSLYAEFVYNIPNPKVALLNIGAEAEKGDLLTKSTYPLMAESKDYNFIGNVEGHEIFLDKADVIVCDGFVGNVILKAAEGFSHIVKLRGIDDEFFESFNPDDYGGTPVLGINSNVIIGHGASNSVAIKNMILLSQGVIEADLPSKIKKYFITDEQD